MANRWMKVAVPEYGEGAYLVLSAKKHGNLSLQGSKWHDKALPDDVKEYYGTKGWQTDPCLTFVYVNGSTAAEWNGADGPIQMWYEAQDGPGYDLDHDPLEPHWIFDKAWGYGAWSQLAVNDSGLPDYFLEGKFQQIFNVLKRWTER